MAGLTQKLDSSWTTDNLFITINKQPLRTTDVLTYEVLYNGPEISGIISFADNENFLEQLPLTIGGFIEISFTSQEQSTSMEPADFNKIFAITSVSHITEKGYNIVDLEFIDMNTKFLRSTYMSRSYTDKPINIFEQYMNDIGLESEIIYVGADEEEEISVQIPSNISALEYLTNELEYRGYSFIQDRHTSYIVHNSKMNPSDAVHTGEVFEYKPKTYYSRAQVIEYDIEGFDIKKLEESIPAINSSINPEKTTINTTTEKIEPSNTTSISDVKTTDMLYENGQKQTTSDIHTLTNELNNLQKMKIWVPGWNGNRLWMKVSVELPRPVFMDQNTNSKELTGDWIVKGTRDKIINTYFVQELYITRAGNE